jgi:hypothetical protein
MKGFSTALNFVFFQGLVLFATSLPAFQACHFHQNKRCMTIGWAVYHCVSIAAAGSFCIVVIDSVDDEQ